MIAVYPRVIGSMRASPSGLPKWRPCSTIAFPGKDESPCSSTIQISGPFLTSTPRSNTRGVGAFATFGWKTGYLECLRLSQKKRRTLDLKLQSGQNIMFRHQGDQYHFDCEYCGFDFERNRQMVDEAVETFRRIMERLDRAIVTRVPVKQELVHVPYSLNSYLVKTVASYNIGWDLLRERTSDLGWISFHKLDGFELRDYQPQDTHWTEAGNTTFAKIVRNNLLPALQEKQPIVQISACDG